MRLLNLRSFMKRCSCLPVWSPSAGCGWLALGMLAALAAPGCEKAKTTTAPSVMEPPMMQVIQPQYRKIVRVVGQPSFVESYERTSVYPKVTGYIEKWNVDIGDKLKKGDVLCTLFVPELVEDRETKWRTVTLDKERVRLAKAVVEVARADVDAAFARWKAAEAIVDKYKSDTARWDSEVNRLAREVKKGVVDPQVLLESQNQHKQSKAMWMAAEADVIKTKAQWVAAKATLEEDIVNVAVAEARVAVSESDAKRLDAWVGYLTIPAPYDGVVIARNANSWDFVLPAAGDPSADKNAPHLSPSGKGAPIYVVDRTDIVRIFVDIPEGDANYVRVGSKARVQIRGYRDQWIPAHVERTSWALNFKSRTLRAEIDLKNFDNKILPGMYAYGKVIIERPNVRAIPESAIMHIGDATYYWSCENGKVHKTEVEIGVSDGEFVEVTNRRVPPKFPGDESWVGIDGSEQVILGDLTSLTEGAEVRIQGAAPPPKDADLAKAP
jgi:HlyD family secretion protein